MTNEVPNPGSDAARALGCRCPVLDNGHGQGRGNGTFWIVQGCPIHGFGQCSHLVGGEKCAQPSSGAAHDISVHGSHRYVPEAMK